MRGINVSNPFFGFKSGNVFRRIKGRLEPKNAPSKSEDVWIYTS